LHLDDKTLAERGERGFEVERGIVVEVEQPADLAGIAP
jgi:hypothetical protein